jgi:Ni/Co efflux regulator RcnB
MFWLTAAALAQPQQQNSAATVLPDHNPNGNLAGSHAIETDGNSDNPAPHIYKRGEHISRGYGAFDVVDDWSRFHLMKPPADSHWVKYGDNYLLVKTDSGLITDIVKAS